MRDRRLDDFVAERDAAWGGVVAQVLVLAVTISVASLLPPRVLVSDLYTTLTGTSVLIAAVNLLPLGRLDGRRAWRLPSLTFLRARQTWLAWRLGRMRAGASARRERLH
jgi:Zn-dependent protease